MQFPRKLQEIVDSISNDRQALLQAVSGLSNAQLDYKPAVDQWSISDILHHLALTDDANVKLASLMLKQAQERALPPDSTPEVSVLGCIDHIAERAATQKAQAPERVAPRSHLPAGESLERLKATRERLVEAIGQLAQYDLSQLVYPHPFFRDLNMYQWLLVASWHESRHTAQIGRIKSRPDFPNG